MNLYTEAQVREMIRMVANALDSGIQDELIDREIDDAISFTPVFILENNP